MHFDMSCSSEGPPTMSTTPFLLLSHVVQGMLLHTLGVVGGAASGIICYAMLLIIRPQPWWHAQYFIPTLGMLLGNCISGVSVGLSAIMEELTTGRRVVPTSCNCPIDHWQVHSILGWQHS